MNHLVRIMSVLAVLITSFATPVLANPDATQMLNTIRADKGRKAVRYSRALEQIAKVHAEDMRRMQAMTHTGSDGSSPGKRARARGYKWCYISENVAEGYRTLDAVMAAWAGSKGHAKNMLNRKAREFGLARADGGYWVMVLARPGCR